MCTYYVPYTCVHYHFSKLKHTTCVHPLPPFHSYFLARLNSINFILCQTTQHDKPHTDQHTDVVPQRGAMVGPRGTAGQIKRMNDGFTHGGQTIRIELLLRDKQLINGCYWVAGVGHATPGRLCHARHIGVHDSTFGLGQSPFGDMVVAIRFTKITAVQCTVVGRVVQTIVRSDNLLQRKQILVHVRLA